MTTVNCEEIEIDTKGTCLLCLEAKVDCQIPNGNSGSLPSLKGLKHFLRYLKVNPKELFNCSSEFLQSMKIREDITLKISLCSGCSSVTEKFNKLYQEYELIQLQFGDCVQSMHQSISKGNENPERVRKYLDQMQPAKTADLVNASIAANLRNETLKKCTLKLQSGHPRVALSQKPNDKIETPVEASTSTDNGNTTTITENAVVEPEPRATFRRATRSLYADKPKSGIIRLKRKYVRRKPQKPLRLTIGTRSSSLNGVNSNTPEITKITPEAPPPEPARRETRSLQNSKEPKSSSPAPGTSRASSLSRKIKRVASNEPENPTGSKSEDGKDIVQEKRVKLDSKKTKGIKRNPYAGTMVPSNMDDYDNDDDDTPPPRLRKQPLQNTPIASSSKKVKRSIVKKIDRCTRSFQQIKQPNPKNPPVILRIKKNRVIQPMRYNTILPPFPYKAQKKKKEISSKKVPKSKPTLIRKPRSTQSPKPPNISKDADTLPEVSLKLTKLDLDKKKPKGQNPYKKTFQTRSATGGKKYYEKSSAMAHRRRRWGVPCDHCSEKSMPGPSVKSHQILKHPEHIISKLLPAHVSLDECRKAVFAVWEHMFEKCSTKQGYVCQLCDDKQLIVTKGSFKRHLISAHENKFAVNVHRQVESLPLDGTVPNDILPESVEPEPSPVETDLEVQSTSSEPFKVLQAPQRKSFACQYCDYVTRFESTLKYHSLERHPTDNVMAFLHTNVSRDECDAVVQLVLGRIAESADDCFKCGTQLANKNLRRHVVVHHFEDILEEVKTGLETRQSETNELQTVAFESEEVALEVEEMEFGDVQLVKVEVEKVRSGFNETDPLDIDYLE